MYICLCRAVTDDEIVDSVKSGNNCIEALQSELGVSTQCGKCLCDVKNILQETLLEQGSIPSKAYLPVVIKRN